MSSSSVTCSANAVFNYMYLLPVILTAVLPSTVALECYKCSGSSSACVDPVNNLDDAGIEIVNCTDGCAVTSHELFSSSVTSLEEIMDLSGIPSISRDCFWPRPSQDSCITWCNYAASSLSGVLTRQVSKTCTECCLDDRCNHGNIEDALDDVQMWCHQCGGVGQYPCDYPLGELAEYNPLMVLQVECNTTCTTSLDLTRFPDDVQSRGCASSISNCDIGCESADNCIFCCQGSLCNDEPRDDLVVRTNFTHSCYKCRGYIDSDCNHNLGSADVDVVQCYDGCKKSVGPDSIGRGCIEAYRRDQCLGQDDVCHTDVCVYCCTGELCNAATVVVPFLSNLTITLILLLWLFSSTYSDV